VASLREVAIGRCCAAPDGTRQATRNSVRNLGWSLLTNRLDRLQAAQPDDDHSAGAAIGARPHLDQTELDPLTTPRGRQAGGGGAVVPGAVRVRPRGAPELVSGEGVAEAVPPIGQALTQGRWGVGVAVPVGHEPDRGAVGADGRDRAPHHPRGSGSGPQSPPERQADHESDEQEGKNRQPPV
jgi:hypothetical protein